MGIPLSGTFPMSTLEEHQTLYRMIKPRRECVSQYKPYGFSSTRDIDEVSLPCLFFCLFFCLPFFMPQRVRGGISLCSPFLWRLARGGVIEPYIGYIACPGLAPVSRYGSPSCPLHSVHHHHDHILMSTHNFARHLVSQAFS